MAWLLKEIPLVSSVLVLNVTIVEGGEAWLFQALSDFSVFQQKRTDV
jgi:hypothetical protein